MRISGNESIPDHRILATLDLPRPYARHRLRQAIEGQIRTFYRGLGYARARVTAVMAASDPFIFDVKIREGRILVYGGLDLKGITAISHAEVTSLYPEQGGRVDWPRIRDANIALRKKYHDVGFAGVIISGKSIVEPSSGQLFYRVRVVEGVHYRVGKVSLPSELGSRFPLSSGDLFRRGQLDEFAQENGLSEEQLRLDRDPVEGVVVAITLLEVEGA